MARNFSHYIARVLTKNEDNAQTQFLRKDNTFLFYYTDQQEIYFIYMEDIILKLRKPTTIGTAKTKGLLSFDVKLINTSVSSLFTKCLTLRLICKLSNQLIDWLELISPTSYPADYLIYRLT